MAGPLVLVVTDITAGLASPEYNYIRYKGYKVAPITPIGFLVGTAGAFILLFFYRLLAGYWFVEGDVLVHRRRYPRSRRYERSHYVDTD